MTQAEVDALTAFRITLHDPLCALAGWDASSLSTPCSWCGVLCSPSSSPHMPLSSASPTSSSLAPSLTAFLLASFSKSSASARTPSLAPSDLTFLPRLPIPPFQLPYWATPTLPPHQSLRSLVFSTIGNLLTGGVPTALPGSLCFLDLSSNILTNPLSDNLSATAPHLQLLNLFFNCLHGTLPPSSPPSVPSSISGLTRITSRAPSPPSLPTAPPSSTLASKAMTFKASFPPPSWSWTSSSFSPFPSLESPHL